MAQAELLSKLVVLKPEHGAMFVGRNFEFGNVEPPTASEAQRGTEGVLVSCSDLLQMGTTPSMACLSCPSWLACHHSDICDEIGQCMHAVIDMIVLYLLCCKAAVALLQSASQCHVAPHWHLCRSLESAAALLPWSCLDPEAEHLPWIPDIFVSLLVIACIPV